MQSWIQLTIIKEKRSLSMNMVALERHIFIGKSHHKSLIKMKDSASRYNIRNSSFITPRQTYSTFEISFVIGT